MKIRKIIPLLAIVLVALFALASCDALLESIYPEQTIDLSGTNSIGVQVDTWYAWNGYMADIYSGPLTIDLHDNATGDIVDTKYQSLSWAGYDPIYAYVTFDGVVNGTYYANAYIDANNNGEDDDGYYNSAVNFSGLVTVSGDEMGYATVVVPE